MTLAIVVTGKVQGVYFRASTLDKAISLGINGFVKNQIDGTVYIEASGGEEILNELVAWCNQGPKHANVERVEVRQVAPKHFTAFEIKRG